MQLVSLEVYIQKCSNPIWQILAVIEVEEIVVFLLLGQIESICLQSRFVSIGLHRSNMAIIIKIFTDIIIIIYKSVFVNVALLFAHIFLDKHLLCFPTIKTFITVFISLNIGFRLQDFKNTKISYDTVKS